MDRNCVRNDRGCMDLVKKPTEKSDRYRFEKSGNGIGTGSGNNQLQLYTLALRTAKD